MGNKLARSHQILFTSCLFANKVLFARYDNGFKHVLTVAIETTTSSEVWPSQLDYSLNTRYSIFDSFDVYLVQERWIVARWHLKKVVQQTECTVGIVQKCLRDFCWRLAVVAYEVWSNSLTNAPVKWGCWIGTLRDGELTSLRNGTIFVGHPNWKVQVDFY